MAAARQGLELERQRYQELFEFAPDGYLVTSANLGIQEANHAAETLLNVRRDRLVGKPLSIFVASEDRDAFHLQQQGLGEGQQIKDWEVRLQPRDRKPFPAAIAVSTIYDSQGQVVGWRWLIRDLTGRKRSDQTRQQLEQERELSKLKSRFINTVSHEYRTPLNVIHASAELLEKRAHHMSEEKKSLLLQKIQVSGQYMNRLLDDVLIYSQAESGELKYSAALIDLELFCKGLIAEHQFSNGSKHAINFTRQGKSPSTCLDARLLRQILDNLLTNALKYSPPNGAVNMELNCESDKITFRIRDQGIGIPPEDQHRLFEPFYRAKNVKTLPGTGLGLAIVKKAVEVLEGAITVESEVGVGTTFTVILPIKNWVKDKNKKPEIIAMQ